MAIDSRSQAGSGTGTPRFKRLMCDNVVQTTWTWSHRNVSGDAPLASCKIGQTLGFEKSRHLSHRIRIYKSQYFVIERQLGRATAKVATRRGRRQALTDINLLFQVQTTSSSSMGGRAQACFPIRTSIRTDAHTFGAASSPRRREYLAYRAVMCGHR